MENGDPNIRQIRNQDYSVPGIQKVRAFKYWTFGQGVLMQVFYANLISNCTRRLYE